MDEEQRYGDAENPEPYEGGHGHVDYVAGRPEDSGAHVHHAQEGVDAGEDRDDPGAQGDDGRAGGEDRGEAMGQEDIRQSENEFASASIFVPQRNRVAVRGILQSQY